MTDTCTSGEYADRILDHIERETDLRGKTLYLALDTSASMPIDGAVISKVAKAAFCTFGIARAVAMSFDTRVLATVTINDATEVNRTQALQMCGGGTNPACVLEAVAAIDDDNVGLWRRVFILTDGMFATNDLAAAARLGVQPILLIVGPNGSHHRGITCHDL